MLLLHGQPSFNGRAVFQVMKCLVFLSTKYFVMVLVVSVWLFWWFYSHVSRLTSHFLSVVFPPFFLLTCDSLANQALCVWVCVFLLLCISLSAFVCLFPGPCVSSVLLFVLPVAFWFVLSFSVLQYFLVFVGVACFFLASRFVACLSFWTLVFGHPLCYHSLLFCFLTCLRQCHVFWPFLDPT